MAGENAPAVDLLGDPWQEPKDPRGRKAHKPTPQSREFIAVLVATGASEEEIALQAGLCTKTLRKYYFRELEHGVSLARLQMLQKLYERGMAGNVAAMKAYLAETQKGQAVEAAYRQRPADRPAAEAKPGKKEEQQRAAEGVGAGVYAPGPPPARLQ